MVFYTQQAVNYKLTKMPTLARKTAVFAKTHTRSPVGEEPGVPSCPLPAELAETPAFQQKKRRGTTKPQREPILPGTDHRCLADLPTASLHHSFLLPQPGRRGSCLPRCDWAGSRMQPGEHRAAARADPGLPSYPHPCPLAWQPCLSDLKIQHHFHSVNLPCN